MKGLKNSKKKRLKFLNNYQFLYKNKYLRSSKNKKETPQLTYTSKSITIIKINMIMTQTTNKQNRRENPEGDPNASVVIFQFSGDMMLGRVAIQL